MKVIAFCGSPRGNGNTMALLKTVCESLENEGVETEIIDLYEGDLSGCRACDQCHVNKDMKCVIARDKLNEYVEKMAKADGILIGSPVYFANVSSNVKSFIDRAGRVGRANGNLYKYKAGAAVAAVRRAGALNVFNSINHFFLISQMFVVGSTYWNLGIGKNRGDVLGDEEGISNMKNLGQNMSWMLKKISDQ
ncbi:MAG: flavodoxin family protein [Deltaproteobacteria bacterium]|nr:flavodoxin family protein [Deltaproteobacteria bacterium]